MTNFPIKTPMVNVNEDEVELVEWHKQKDQYIKPGELLATFESTKSTYEFSSPSEGYFTPIVESGSTVMVGQVIGYLTDQIGGSVDELQLQEESEDAKQDNEVSWTRKALLLAQRNHLAEKAVEAAANTNQITEQVVLDHIAKQQAPAHISPASGVRNKIERVLILGGGNVAALVIDILTRVPHQTPVGILDDNPALQGSSVLGVPVLGSFSQIEQLQQANIFDAAALAVGILPARKDIFQEMSAKGILFTNIIDPTVVIGANASMGSGNMLMAFCRLGPEAIIGDNNFLSAYVNIEHHNQMGSHCTFGPSVYMSGGVEVGNAVKFGTGIAVEPRLSIGDNTVVASGVTLTANVPPNTLVKAKTSFTF